jgi:SAM-dependent methyltransferase
MQTYRRVLTHGNLNVRESVLDDLSTYFGMSPDDCVMACVNWEQWSVAEWASAGRDTSAGLANFYHTTKSWAFDLLWYAYLQAEGYAYPVSVVVADHLPDCVRGGRHLDFGSGAGTTSQFFSHLGYESELADISTSLLSFAAYRLDRRHEAHRRIDLNRTELESNRYDVITAIDTLVHVPDLEKVAASLHRALRANGILVANFDVRPRTPENAWHLYSDDLPLRWKLQRAGFEPMVNLDRYATLYRKVDTSGLRFKLRRVRDDLLLRGSWRPAYRSLKFRVHTRVASIRPSKSSPK